MISQADWESSNMYGLAGLAGNPGSWDTSRSNHARN